MEFSEEAQVDRYKRGAVTFVPVEGKQRGRPAWGEETFAKGVVVLRELNLNGVADDL